MESEFIAITETAREIVWLENIFDQCVSIHIIKGPFPQCILHADDQAAIEFSSSPIENHRSKHINVRYFLVRVLIYEGIFEVKTNLLIPSLRLSPNTI